MPVHHSRAIARARARLPVGGARDEPDPSAHAGRGPGTPAEAAEGVSAFSSPSCLQRVSAPDGAAPNVAGRTSATRAWLRRLTRRRSTLRSLKVSPGGNAAGKSGERLLQVCVRGQELAEMEAGQSPEPVAHER